MAECIIGIKCKALKLQGKLDNIFCSQPHFGCWRLVDSCLFQILYVFNKRKTNQLASSSDQYLILITDTWVKLTTRAHSTPRACQWSDSEHD